MLSATLAYVVRKHEYVKSMGRPAYHVPMYSSAKTLRKRVLLDTAYVLPHVCCLQWRALKVLCFTSSYMLPTEAHHEGSMLFNFSIVGSKLLELWKLLKTAIAHSAALPTPHVHSLRPLTNVG